MITLYQVGDRELWVATDRDRTWSLPMWVDWKWDKEADKHYGLVMPCLGTYTSQALALQALLGTHDIQGRQTQWLIPRSMVEAILIKAPGITPLAYYKWPEANHPALPLTNPMSLSPKGAKPRTSPGSADYEAFVTHLCHVNGFPNSVARIIMRAIADEAPKWMLESRRALDLGFCRLIAVPYRPNWKEIVAFKFRRWKLINIFNRPVEERMKALDEAGMPGVLCSTHNIGLYRASNYRVEYSLEAIPGPKFETAANKVEAERQACGTTSYVASYEKTIAHLYHHILDALSIYLRKTARPFAIVSERGKAGLLRFLPTQGNRSKVRGVGLRNLPVHIVAPDSNFTVFGEASDKNLVRAKAPPVRPVPALPPGADDLRERRNWTPLAEPPQRGAGTTGLPVLDVGEGSDGWKPVLPGPEAGGGEAPGLDQPGDRGEQP